MWDLFTGKSSFFNEKANNDLEASFLTLVSEDNLKFEDSSGKIGSLSQPLEILELSLLNKYFAESCSIQLRNRLIDLFQREDISPKTIDLIIACLAMIFQASEVAPLEDLPEEFLNRVWEVMDLIPTDNRFYLSYLKILLSLTDRRPSVAMEMVRKQRKIISTLFEFVIISKQEPFLLETHLKLLENLTSFEVLLESINPKSCILDIVNLELNPSFKK